MSSITNPSLNPEAVPFTPKRSSPSNLNHKAVPFTPRNKRCKIDYEAERKSIFGVAVCSKSSFNLGAQEFVPRPEWSTLPVTETGFAVGKIFNKHDLQFKMNPKANEFIPRPEFPNYRVLEHEYLVDELNSTSFSYKSTSIDTNEELTMIANILSALNSKTAKSISSSQTYTESWVSKLNYGEFNKSRTCDHSSLATTPIIPTSSNYNDQDPESTCKYQISLTKINEPRPTLSPIILDGTDVALNHGDNALFSSRGIAIAIEYFYRLGHREFKAFLPSFRNPRHKLFKMQELYGEYTFESNILESLQYDYDFISYTPSNVNNMIKRDYLDNYNSKIVVKPPDRYKEMLLKYAMSNDGLIISNDVDLIKEAKFLDMDLGIVKDRLVLYKFIGDVFCSLV